MPLQLPHSSENFVHLHRQMLNNHYNDAVKYLRLALYSATPLSAALLPLVQVNFVFLATFLMDSEHLKHKLGHLIFFIEIQIYTSQKTK